MHMCFNHCVNSSPPPICLFAEGSFYFINETVCFVVAEFVNAFQFVNE